MGATGLRDSQMRMARYLRDPAGEPPPEGIEPRRLKIYQDLIYNNIEGFISGGFPVLRRLYTDEQWHGLVRAFIDGHRCRTPYFLEIGQEFLQFLAEDHQPRPCDPAFLAELAHYEWVELALDVSEEEVPAPVTVADSLSVVPRLSPLAWLLSYHFPVHRIGPDFRPDSAGEPTYLVVYRDRADKVRFMELNAPTARLLDLVRSNEGRTVARILDDLADELGMAPDALRGFGAGQLTELIEQGIVAVAPVTSGT